MKDLKSKSGQSNALWTNRNRLLIGATGSGKTTEVIRYIKSTDESFIAADTKSNLFRRFSADLKRRGFKTVCIDLNDPADNVSSGYNPLSYIGRKKAGNRTVYSERDILSLSNTLVPVMDSHDPFWEDMAKQVLSMLISYVLEEIVPEEQNLTTVSELFKVMSFEISKSESCTFLEEHCFMHPETLAARSYQMIKGSVKADKTWNCIYAFVINALKVYECNDVRQLITKKETFRIEELGQRKCALFINVSDSDRALDPLVNTFYTQCFQTLLREADAAEGSRLKEPVKIILDDFAASCVIPDFDKLISVIRSRNISTDVILQSLSQLFGIYGQYRSQTIITNCDTLLYLGGADIETVSYMSERLSIPFEQVMQMSPDCSYTVIRGRKPVLNLKKLPADEYPTEIIPRDDLPTETETADTVG